MRLSRRRRPAPMLVAALLLPLVLGASGAASAESRHANEPRQSITAQSSGTETPLPVFEMHSGFWVNLHHFLYLQARLMKGNPGSAETGRGASSPDELPVSLIDFRA